MRCLQSSLSVREHLSRPLSHSLPLLLSQTNFTAVTLYFQLTTFLLLVIHAARRRPLENKFLTMKTRGRNVGEKRYGHNVSTPSPPTTTSTTITTTTSPAAIRLGSAPHPCTCGPTQISTSRGFHDFETIDIYASNRKSVTCLRFQMQIRHVASEVAVPSTVVVA